MSAMDGFVSPIQERYQTLRGNTMTAQGILIAIALLCIAAWGLMAMLQTW
jgi:hypothetical protein